MKKKGFTLIELLAVILILGIITLIAIPIVSKILSQSKKSSFETTINNVVSAIEDTCRLQQLKDQDINYTYNFLDGLVSPTLSIKGKLPKTGVVKVDSNCNTVFSLTNGSYTATKTNPAVDFSVINGSTVDLEIHNIYADGTAVYFNPNTGEKCNSASAVSTTGTKSGCMKWYAFGDTGYDNESLNLILDHNTSSSIWSSTGDNVTGPNSLLNQLKTDTDSWAGLSTRTDSYTLNNGISNYTINYSTYKARLITANEVASISKNITFNELTSYGWFYLSTNTQEQQEMTKGQNAYAWLFDYTNQCTVAGCKNVDDSTYGYWTATASGSHSLVAWRVDHLGNVNYGAVYDGGRGVRPVITISKTVIE